MAEATPKTPITKKWWFWVIVIALIAFAFWVITSLSSDNVTGNTNIGNTSISGNKNDYTNSTDKTKNTERTASSSDQKSETMSAADIYVWLSENNDIFSFSVPEKSISFMQSNPQFFPGNDNNTCAMYNTYDDAYDA